MKAILEYKDNRNRINDIFLCDSTINKARNPFFIPDERKWSGMLLYGVRINRLGKNIAARYASLYYTECLSAVHPFVEGDDGTYADRWGFDGALTVSDCSEASSLNDNARRDIDLLIEKISKNTTLKTGDLILLPAGDTKFEINAPGEDFFLESACGAPKMKFKVR